LKITDERQNDQRAIIGAAVTALLRADLPLHSENILTMLQLMGASAGNPAVKAICCWARDYIVRSTPNE